MARATKERHQRTEVNYRDCIFLAIRAKHSVSKRKPGSRLCIAADRGNDPQALLTVVCLTLPTVVAVVIHQDDLLEKVGGRPVHGRVNGAQDDGRGLVHKDEHDADLREVRMMAHVFTPMEKSW